VPLRMGVRTPLSGWKEEGAGAWSSAAGRQLVEEIEDRTDTHGSMRHFVAMHEMDGAVLARLHHIQWCWQLRMGVQQDEVNGDWRTMVAGKWQFRCTWPRSGPTSAQ
jgi:hypothetical protein